MVDWVTYGLVGLNALLYSWLAYQLLGRKLAGKVRAGTVSEAFTILGNELRAAVPGIPSGFTWREGISHAQGLGLDVDWREIRREVDSYEAYRYGGRSEEPGEYGEVLTLARELRRAR